jgi:hypothetical protein
VRPEFVRKATAKRFPVPERNAMRSGGEVADARGQAWDRVDSLSDKLAGGTKFE